MCQAINRCPETKGQLTSVMSVTATANGIATCSKQDLLFVSIKVPKGSDSSLDVAEMDVGVDVVESAGRVLSCNGRSDSA